MKMNAAVLWDVHEEWSVEEIELDGPKEGEVLVSYAATGCATPTITFARVTFRSQSRW